VLCAAVFVEFVLLAVMSPASVPLSLDMVLPDMALQVLEEHRAKKQQ
jgi:hypothetical protein